MGHFFRTAWRYQRRGQIIKDIDKEARFNRTHLRDIVDSDLYRSHLDAISRRTLDTIDILTNTCRIQLVTSQADKRTGRIDKEPKDTQMGSAIAGNPNHGLFLFYLPQYILIRP